MVRSSATRSFNVGETVHFRSRVSLPGSRTPTDPAVVSLTYLGNEGQPSILGAPVPFTREREGEYVLAIQTTDMLPGVYNVSITHSSGPEKVTVVADQFVLQPPWGA